MENKYNLFSIGESIKLPLWDIVRYSVYRSLNYPKNYRLMLKTKPKKSYSDFRFGIIETLKLSKLICSERFHTLVITCSRYVDRNGLYYDKSALPIIEALGKDYLVIETGLANHLAYNAIHDMSNSIRRLYFPLPVNDRYYKKIDEIVYEAFGVHQLSKKEFDEIIRIYKSQYLFYSILLRLTRPKHLAICTGNPKAIVKAANDYNIITHLVQHAGIELDEIDYSYPARVSRTGNILFPDNLLTFNEYWCKNINVPALKIYPIGNSYFSKIPTEQEDGSILIISTIVHGQELSELTLEASETWPDKHFIYKLHPNEFHLVQKYDILFRDRTNVSVITTDPDTSVLIARSKIVVLIVSAVLYEALQQNKTIAIYKRINYKRQEMLSFQNRLEYFDNVKELSNIINGNKPKEPMMFYDRSNKKLIRDIFV